MTMLEDVAREASGCTKCRLSAGRTQVVFGDGSPEADVMFIGEGPGFHEDKQGIPFVGAAGQLLNKLLEEVGLSRDEVYIANVIKCLRYNANVQLGDGSWERIGRLVARRYDGTVLSVDAEGNLVPKRVVGWHASPLADRRVFRLTYRSAKRAGLGRVGIELTGDHPVLTDHGYVAVEHLSPGTRIATGQGLSRLAWDVVCGTLIGDGHLNRRSAHLSFGHSARQREYAEFKAKLLAELEPRVGFVTVAAAAGGDKVYPAVHVRTRAHRALGILRSDFYTPEKRVPEWMAERLNPRMLAIWFMDDGYLRVRRGRSPIAEIASVGFSEGSLLILVRALARLGLQVKAHRGRLLFNVAMTRALSELIAPYVLPEMRYKLIPDVAAAKPFDPSLFHEEAPEVMYDEVEIEDVTDRARSDVTFYCIDVEETHNFVTAGGVVHNCRPPGNRDPMPDEIESCTPYLLQQVELISPRVIVTLGNFATRFILERPVAISRVRGQKSVWRGRTVIPTFHPAAVLHGGGEAGPQMAALREDFRTLKAALAEAPPVVEEQLGLF